MRIPAHNGEAQNRQSADSNDVVRDDFIVGPFATAGNAVGSPLLSNEYDPVTTEPKGEASVTVTLLPYGGWMANLQSVQYAGSWLGLVPPGSSEALAATSVVTANKMKA